MHAEDRHIPVPRLRQLSARGLSGFSPISGHLLPFRVILKQIPDPSSFHP